MNKSHFHPHGCRCRDMGLPSSVHESSSIWLSGSPSTFILFAAPQKHSAWDIRSKKSVTGNAPFMFLAIHTPARWGEGLLHDCLFPGFRSDLPSRQYRCLGFLIFCEKDVEFLRRLAGGSLARRVYGWERT